MEYWHPHHERKNLARKKEKKREKKNEPPPYMKIDSAKKMDKYDHTQEGL